MSRPKESANALVSISTNDRGAVQAQSGTLEAGIIEAPSVLRSRTAEFRAELRRDLADKNGTAYALKVLGLLVGIVVALVVAMPPFGWTHLALLMVYFLFMNLFEYVLHRYPMHRRMKGLEVIFQHVTVHHAFFSEEGRYFEEPRDWFAVILPPPIILGMSTAIALIAGLIYLITRESSHAIFFAIVGFAYYLLYELLHFAYHAPETSLIKRSRAIRSLAELHLNHHRRNWMSKYNFNITFPIFDWIFGTIHKEPAGRSFDIRPSP